MKEGVIEQGVSGQALRLGRWRPCSCLACFVAAALPPEVTLSNSRKMGTTMKRMMSRVWIMMIPSFSVFRRFSCAQVLNPAGGRTGRVRLSPLLGLHA